MYIQINERDPVEKQIKQLKLELERILDTLEVPAVDTGESGGSGEEYVHPASHPASMITESSSKRFVTDGEKTTWSGKQDALGFTPENVANKKTSLTDNSDDYYPTQKAVKMALDGKADTSHGHSISNISGLQDALDGKADATTSNPSGDGTEETYTGTLSASGSTYTGLASAIRMKQSTWIDKIKIYVGASATGVILNIREYGGNIVQRVTGISLTGASWNTITLPEPIYMGIDNYFVLEFLFTSAQNLHRNTSTVYNGTMWAMIHNRINNYFGTSYAETPGIGLIEYSE